MDTPEIFISYAWRDESLKITEALDAFFQAQGITIVRDNRDIGYKGLIKDYMQRLGKGKYVVVVLSDQYFKSKSCMYELLQLSRQEGFYDRIFPVSVSGLSIYEAEDVLRYARYWDEKIEHLQQEIKNTANIANLQGITDDLNLYVEIRQNIAKLIDFLRNINTHPLKGADFEPLLKAIRAKIAQDQAQPVAVKEVKTMELSVTLRRQIVDFFMSLPDIYNPGNPQALIQSASLDPQLLSQISFTGAPGQFFQLLLPILLQYGRLRDGRHALQAVLEAAKDLLGDDGRTACDNLIRALGWTPSEYKAYGQAYGAPAAQPSVNAGNQTIHISVGGNATFEGVSFGDGGKIISKVTNAGDLMQADDSTVTITKTTATQSGMSIEEVLKLFEQMLTVVNDLEGVPRKAKIEAKAEVEKAIAEIEEPEKGKAPDKKTVAEHLKKATATLKEAGATALQAATFGKLVAQAVEWLGTNYQWLLEMLV